jgi:hypothetical protein
MNDVIKTIFRAIFVTLSFVVLGPFSVACLCTARRQGMSYREAFVHYLRQFRAILKTVVDYIRFGGCTTCKSITKNEFV